MQQDKRSTPYVTGALIAALGAGMLWPGLQLLLVGGTAYYIVAGILMLASGIDLIRGATRGFYTFAVLLLLKPEKMKNSWKGLLLGRQFEYPGSALKYILSAALFEAWSLLHYLTSSEPGAVVHIYTLQLFALGGVGVYDQTVLSRPRQITRSLFQLVYLEAPIFLGLIWDETVDMPLGEARANFSRASLVGCCLVVAKSAHNQ